MQKVIQTVSDYPGIKLAEFEKNINMSHATINKCIKYLLVNGDIYKDRGVYYKTPKAWEPDLEKSAKITEIRKNELKQMNEFVNIAECYMEYIADALDDINAKPCGCCDNCRQGHIFNVEVPLDDVIRAQAFIKNDYNVIEPRKRWPMGVRISEQNTIPADRRCEEGRVLCNYGDAGWGKHVSDCKYKKGIFDEQLVDASVKLLRSFVSDNQIAWITSIPSIKRPELVKNFAMRISDKLGLPYQESVIKICDNRRQKELNTSYLQFKNADESFEVEDVLEGKDVLLIDDMVDSKWTFTVCGYKLRDKGCGRVFTYALANTAGRNGDE